MRENPWPGVYLSAWRRSPSLPSSQSNLSPSFASISNKRPTNANEIESYTAQRQHSTLIISIPIKTGTQARRHRLHHNHSKTVHADKTAIAWHYHVINPSHFGNGVVCMLQLSGIRFCTNHEASRLFFGKAFLVSFSCGAALLGELLGWLSTKKESALSRHCSHPQRIHPTSTRRFLGDPNHFVGAESTTTDSTHITPIPPITQGTQTLESFWWSLWFPIIQPHPSGRSRLSTLLETRDLNHHSFDTFLTNPYAHLPRSPCYLLYNFDFTASLELWMSGVPWPPNDIRLARRSHRPIQYPLGFYPLLSRLAARTLPVRVI